MSTMKVTKLYPHDPERPRFIIQHELPDGDLHQIGDEFRRYDEAEARRLELEPGGNGRTAFCQAFSVFQCPKCESACLAAPNLNHEFFLCGVCNERSPAVDWKYATFQIAGWTGVRPAS